MALCSDFAAPNLKSTWVNVRNLRNEKSRDLEKKAFENEPTENCSLARCPPGTKIQPRDQKEAEKRDSKQNFIQKEYFFEFSAEICCR